MGVSSLVLNISGNDTIDPYPLIPGEAKKILIVKNDIFEELRDRYKSFCLGLAGRPAKRSSIIRAPGRRFLRPQAPLPEKTHFLAYEPSNAIAVNECDYRRWCRVNEWFAEFGPEAEKFERTMLIQ
jgi:hypothetical protein